MDIRADGQAIGILHLLQDLQSTLDARAAMAVDRGAVRLIKGRLECIGDAQLPGNILHLRRDRKNHFLRLNNAGTCDQLKHCNSPLCIPLQIP